VILYVCRHGEAERIKGTSEEMHLTRNGDTQVDRVSSLAKKLGMIPDVILSSPLARSLESAEVARKVFDAPVRTTEVLEPNRDSSEVFKFLNKEFRPSQRVMLITHFPLLTYLLVDLLCDSKESRIMFRPASMAAIECEPKPGKGKGKLFWLLAPDPV
jgi:phosphohistidine phosphatase